jgi:hypothetical protein
MSLVMSARAVQFLVDGEGKRTAVVLDLQHYQTLLEAQEELECVREFDAAKAAGETPIPFEEAMREIEETWK